MTERPSPARRLLLLIDGNALVHRAFHAVPPLTTSKGELVNAVFGVAEMLFKALTDLRPDCVVAAFDQAGPTFRHLTYAEYKAQRPSAPDGLYEQFRRVYQLLEALNIPVVGVEGYEADDIIGTLARQAVEQGWEVVIVTGDTDALQLVGPGIRVLAPLRGFSETVLYDATRVEERYGLRPEQLVDFKALKGDPSDNIKGVPGIGEKTARRLLQEYGSLDNLLANLDRLDPKIARLLREHGEAARQARELVRIVTTVPVQFDLDRCQAGRYDRQRLVAFLRELEFRRLLDRLPPGAAEEGEATGADRPAGAVQLPLFDGASASAPPSTDRRAAVMAGPAWPGVYHTVATPGDLERLVARLSEVRGFALDTETDALDPMRAALVGLAVAWEPGEAYYLPVGHQRTDGDAQLSWELVRARLGPFLADPRWAKYGHHLKFDLIVLARHGVQVRGLAFDTLLGAYLLESTQRALNLKDLAFLKLGLEMTPITDLIGKGRQQVSMASVPVPLVAAYAGADVDVVLRLRALLEPELRAAGLWSLFADVEMPLIPVLAAMELTGVAVDVPYLQEMSRALAERIGALEEAIYAAVGHRFNLNSPQQLGRVLFEELGLPALRRTKTGYSTDAETLDELRGAHPVVDLLRAYRQLVKLKSTYVDALPTMVHPRTGRVHTSFNQAGTSTGRLASADPNLQNIPVRTELGRQVRRAFIADRPDWVLVSADYSQIELRILAHITGDRRLREAFQRGEDVHVATAAEVFGVPPDAVTPEMRRVAKMVNYAIAYGLSEYGLAQRANITREEAQRIIHGYLTRYAGIADYIVRIKRLAEEQGYVTTLWGRRCYIPEIRVSNRTVRQAAERRAINAPIQGSNADLIKIAMVRLHRALGEQGLASRMILQVHDELLFEAPAAELPVLIPLVQEIMSEVEPPDGPFTVPIEVEVRVGTNWADVTPVGEALPNLADPA